MLTDEMLNQATLAELKKMLFDRELAKARYGIATPPHVIIEAERITAKIAQVQQSLTQAEQSAS